MSVLGAFSGVPAFSAGEPCCRRESLAFGLWYNVVVGGLGFLGGRDFGVVTRIG